MYQHILIPVENSLADETILTHIKPLARMTGAKLLLVHVADGWVARNFNQLQLAESDEMKQDRAYLEKRRDELAAEGFTCAAVLALGEPSDEIIKLAREKNIDLIAMTPMVTGLLVTFSTARLPTRCGTRSMCRSCC